MAARVEGEISQKALDSPKAAVLMDADPESTPEILVPMLDVHAPHEALHTWKGFFIHIATIVVGLLIAVGLERGVEYLHNRYQLSDARAELAQEIEDNAAVVAKNREALGKFKDQLDANMSMLLAEQGSSSPAALNLPYQWLDAFHWPPNGAWQVLRQHGALALMSHRALADYTYFYEGVSAFQEAAKGLAVQVDVAGAIARRAPGGVLGAGGIQELIAATSECQGRLAYLIKILAIEEVGLRNLRSALSH
jgi:hypothetical protein